MAGKFLRTGEQKAESPGSESRSSPPSHRNLTLRGEDFFEQEVALKLAIWDTQRKLGIKDQSSSKSGNRHGKDTDFEKPKQYRSERERSADASRLERQKADLVNMELLRTMQAETSFTVAKLKRTSF
jgi:hypothetical protein